MSKKIDSFTGKYGFLSNFFYSPVPMPDGLTYVSAEHAYQAHKSMDMEVRQSFLRARLSSAEAKEKGKWITLRDDWEENKILIMTDIVRRKFKALDLMADLLIKTEGMELIEGNAHGDRFWGVCEGEGENHLGKILMRVRAEIQTPEVVLPWRNVVEFKKK